jgi:hypothetical protein
LSHTLTWSSAWDTPVLQLTEIILKALDNSFSKNLLLREVLYHLFFSGELSCGTFLLGETTPVCFSVREKQ